MDLTTLFPMTGFDSNSFYHFLPLMILTLGAVLSMCLAAVKGKGATLSYIVSLTALILSGASLLSLFSLETLTFQNGMLVFDAYTKLGSLVLILMGILSVMNIKGSSHQEKLLPEVFALLLFSLCGMIFFISSNHLGFLFIALEIMSLAIYVMVGLKRSSQFAAEASLKYFILGGVASAIFLYGGAIMFGATGTFLTNEMMARLMTLPSAQQVLFTLGAILFICGLLFKVGAFPFHFWLPDVYQGAPTAITGFMSATVKFSSFLVLVRFMLPLSSHLLAEGSYLPLILSLSAVTSMFWGNIGALGQNSLKRLLSYSTIAHSGYLLVGILSLHKVSAAQDAIFLYLLFYGLANIGTFSLLSLLEKTLLSSHHKAEGSSDLHFNQVAGLALGRPLLASMMTIFILAMAGIPLTSGFMIKYLLFKSAVSGGEMMLAILAVMSSVISVYYYLKVLIYMFMKEAPAAPVAAESTLLNPAKSCPFAQWNNLFTSAVSVVITLLFGIVPQLVLRFLGISL